MFIQLRAILLDIVHIICVPFFLAWFEGLRIIAQGSLDLRHYLYRLVSLTACVPNTGKYFFSSAWYWDEYGRDLRLILSHRIYLIAVMAINFALSLGTDSVALELRTAHTRIMCLVIVYHNVLHE